MDLKQILTENNVTKAELARFFGVHWNTVNNWCKNPKNMKVGLIEQINDFILRTGQSEVNNT